MTNRGTHNINGVKNGEGSVSVLDFATRKVIATWTIPGGGSPDMGNLSADGKWLWLSGRYDGVIYAFNTDDGSVKTIPVGGMPHGLTVWPQPGPLLARPHRQHAVGSDQPRPALPVLTPEWSSFFTAELGALASLTGFVVVAISINLTRILAFASLPGRAAEALIAPVGAITATGLILVPDQSSMLAAAAILATGLVMVAAPTVIQLRTWSARKGVTAVERIVRFGASAGFSLTFVIGGALLMAGAHSGLVWLAAGDIACIIAVVLSAWVLMIEILR